MLVAKLELEKKISACDDLIELFGITTERKRITERPSDYGQRTKLALAFIAKSKVKGVSTLQLRNYLRSQFPDIVSSLPNSIVRNLYKQGKIVRDLETNNIKVS